MKADWDKLGSAYADSESVLIVDADCTGPAQSTCGAQGVKGYPTIKYYMAGSKSGKDYQSGRDFASLKKFVESTLNKASCDPITQKGCKPIEKKFIDANKDKSLDELKATVAERSEQFKEAKEAFKKAKTDFKAQEAEFKKAEKKNQMAETILKKLIKEAEKAKGEL